MVKKSFTKNVVPLHTKSKNKKKIKSMNPRNLNSVIRNFVETAKSERQAHKQLSKEYCLEILKQNGATSKATAISFEEYDDKPSINSCNCITTDDVASAEVIRVWCEGDFIYADLDFYYQQSSTDDVLISNDYEFDWVVLLDYLQYKLKNNKQL